MKTGKKHLWDIALIGFCLVLGLVLLVVLRGGKEPGAAVVIKVRNTEIARYSLSVDGVYTLNGGSNTLKIEDGKAWMIEADCPKTGGDVCTEHGKIWKDGQMITCKPNLLVVEVVGGESDDIDLIS
jgi:hypothetical protein